MKSVVIYWSASGNTQAMAEAIFEGMQLVNEQSEMYYVSEFDKNIEEYDVVALGCPSMGVEELEEYEFAPFYQGIAPLLVGKRVVLFGSYGWGSGEWMETWKQEADAEGIEVVETYIAQEMPTDEQMQELKDLGARVASE